MGAADLKLQREEVVEFLLLMIPHSIFFSRLLYLFRRKEYFLIIWQTRLGLVYFTGAYHWLKYVVWFISTSCMQLCLLHDPGVVDNSLSDCFITLTHQSPSWNGGASRSFWSRVDTTEANDDGLNISTAIWPVGRAGSIAKEAPLKNTNMEKN